MLMQVACIGISSRVCQEHRLLPTLPVHAAAPLGVREAMQCSAAELAANARRFPKLAEWAVLSTCHRVELYGCWPEAQVSPVQQLVELLATAGGCVPDSLLSCVYSFVDRSAAEHLCRVAAGLESMILGEPQILGQVGAARIAAEHSSSCGPTLLAIFRAAVRAGKRARSETGINRNPLSVSAVALTLAERTVGDLQRHSALIVGLGNMGRQALQALHQRGVRRLAVANRTRARMDAVIQQFDSRAYTLDELPQALPAAEIIVCATSSPTPLLTEPLVRRALVRREQLPLVILDIGVPRNVDPAVRSVPGVTLFDVDDLRIDLDESLAQRRREIPLVEAIVEEELDNLDRDLRQLAIVPLITDLRQQAEAIRQRELARALDHLRDSDPQVIEQFQHLSHSLVNGLLHGPTARLRQLATDGKSAEHASAVRELFGLRS